MQSNTKEIYLTENGYEEIKKELDDLKLVKRPEVIQALKEARALGDLSENIAALLAIAGITLPGAGWLFYNRSV